MKYILITLLILFSLSAHSTCDGKRDYNFHNGDWNKFSPEWGCMGFDGIVVSDGIWPLSPKESYSNNIDDDELVKYVLYLESQLESIVISGGSTTGKITINVVFSSSKNPVFKVTGSKQIEQWVINQIEILLPKLVTFKAKKTDVSFNFDYKVNWEKA